MELPAYKILQKAYNKERQTDRQIQLHLNAKKPPKRKNHKNKIKLFLLNNLMVENHQLVSKK